MNKDRETFDRILASDYVANIDGRAMTRAQTMADYLRRDVAVESASTSDLTTLVFGDHAFVSGTYDLTGTTGGRDTSGRYWFADVFVRRDGRWQARGAARGGRLQGAAVPGWIPGVGWSDHRAYWQAGYPAIMITDTALFRYGPYHALDDLPHQIDYDRMTRVVAGLVAVVDDLAGGA